MVFNGFNNTLKLRSCFLWLFVFVWCLNPALAQNNTQKIDSLLKIAKQITNIDSSSKMIEEAILQSKKINYTKGVINGTLTKGVNLFNQGRFEESLKLIHGSEQLILDSEDNISISHLYALMGNCYGRLFFFEKSKACLLKSLFYGEQIADEKIRYFNLGRTYGIMGNNIEKNTKVPVNLDSALYYRKKAYTMQQKVGNTANSKSVMIIQGNAIAHTYLKKKMPDSARHYLNQVLAVVKSYKLEKYALETYTGLGALHHQQKSLDSALYYYQQALNIAIKTNDAIDIKNCYQQLAAINEQMGNQTKSYQYLKKYGQLADSLAVVNKNAVKSSADIIVDETERDHAHKKMYYSLIIIGSVLLLIILGYILINFRKRHRKIVSVHKIKQEQLYQKLAFLKEKSLTDKVDEQSLKEIVELAMTNDPAFLIRFKEGHPIFVQRLMELAPSLVNAEFLICAQLRLGFYTKEIARYTHASVRSIEGKKYRIRKKLNIPASEDINVWMMQL